MKCIFSANLSSIYKYSFNMGNQENTTQNTQDEFSYSVPVGPQKDGQTRVYRHPKYSEKLLQIPSNLNSLSDFWDVILSKYSQNLALQSMTYKEVDNFARSLGSWLVQNKHKRIYLYAKNTPEWTITDIACFNYGIVNIPLYDTLGVQAFQHTIKLTQGTAIFTSNDLTNNLLSYISKNRYNLTTVVYLDSPSQQNIEQLKGIGLEVKIIKDLLSFTISERPKLGLDSHWTYLFTSGTTGLPKGVIGTHRMFIAQCLAMKNYYEYKQTDVHLSFLPIAHAFQRFVVTLLIWSGSNIKYSQFPITQITKDFARAKPTTIPIVPRLLNKFYPICKGIFQKQQSTVKIKGLFGGNLRIIVTGSAPISPEVLTFFSKVLECDIREGYGQTETTAASFLTYEGDTNYGHVGGVNSITEFKLVDVPEMNYLTSTNPPRGQVCVRGDSVFKGYYLDEQNTKQTIDSDGWNHTGDVGIILPSGALKIVDRKKNIYKLSQGEYVAPEKIENIYLRLHYIAQCFIYGDSLQNNNVAVVHPALELLGKIAEKLGIQQTDPQKLCENKQIEQFILKQMIQHGKRQGLFGFQLARKVKLWPVSFRNLGIFTSTMKLQRHIAKKCFLKQIEEMYKQNQ